MLPLRMPLCCRHAITHYAVATPWRYAYRLMLVELPPEDAFHALMPIRHAPLFYLCCLSFACLDASIFTNIATLY